MLRAYILLIVTFIFTTFSQAQEVPLERCDRLHVIPVKVGNHSFRFLVDTGATSMLDLHSFSNGSSKDVEVTSWSGTLATSAREFPLGTIHVAVVDPGVGGPRRGVVLDDGAQRFVGPDNGIFALAAPFVRTGWQITAPGFRRDASEPSAS